MNEETKVFDSVVMDNGHGEVIEKTGVTFDEGVEILRELVNEPETIQKNDQRSGNNKAVGAIVGVGIIGGLGLLYKLVLKKKLHDRKVKKCLEFLEKEGFAIQYADEDDFEDDDFFEVEPDDKVKDISEVKEESEKKEKK